MSTQYKVSVAALILGLTAASSYAQSVVSAHSGTLHYFDGAVFIDGNRIESKVGKFNEIKDNSILRTELGRAEILLTPGVFLRVGENTEIKMLDNRLLSTRVEILSGSAIIESEDPEVSVKDPAVTIIYKDYEVQPVKYCAFEITSSPSQLRVFKGQANVSASGGTNRATVKEGRLMPFSAALLTEKFDEKQADDLYLWARDRSAYLSAANMSSARTLASSGFTTDALYAGGYSGLGFNDRFRGGWYYNNYLNMYTYMPYGGIAWSPFGYGYYSPYTIYSFYSPGGYYWHGGSARSSGVHLTNIGTSSLAASQISRMGSGTNTHPTLGSPVRTVGAAANPNASPGFRGGMADFGGQQRGYSNPGFSSGPVSSGSSGGFSPAAGGSRGAVAVGPPAGGANVGGGNRGK